MLVFFLNKIIKRMKRAGDKSEKEPLLGKESTEPVSKEQSAPTSLPEWLHNVPGYGLLLLVKKTKPYGLYVLFMMLMAYLFNQLDRYTLSIVTTLSGPDVGYGDYGCMAIPQYAGTANISKHCTNITSEDSCISAEGGYNSTCRWAHTGTGLEYQIVAGPVFNNLYPLAGLFTGYLADYGRRTLWLSLSLAFWSVMTGVTGFAHTFWHLVVLRALLAIGAAGCTPFAISILSDYIPSDLRGSAFSIYYWGIYIGYSMAYAIGNGIAEILNWRWVFFISGLAGLAVAPLIFLTVREPARTKTAGDEKAKQSKAQFAKQSLFLIVKTFLPCFFPGMFILCIAGGIRNAGGYVWAYNTENFFKARGYSSDTISSFMSWIPLVGGSLGAAFGGIISDIIVKRRGPYARVWVLIISQVAAAPFAAGALFLPKPWCFLSLIPSNVIGEMWVGVTTAIVVDLAPSAIRTTAVAIYLFIITVIGGNFNIMVSPIQSALETHQHMSYYDSYKWTLFLTFPGVYAASSILFVVAFFVMRCDIKRKQKIEEALVLNASS